MLSCRFFQVLFNFHLKRNITKILWYRNACFDQLVYYLKFAKLSILFHALSYVQNFDKCLVSECRIFYSPDLKSVQTLTRLSFAFFIKVQQSTILIWCSFDNESGGKYQDNIHRYLGGMAMCFIVSFLSFCSFVSLRSPFL